MQGVAISDRYDGTGLEFLPSDEVDIRPPENSGEYASQTKTRGPPVAGLPAFAVGGHQFAFRQSTTSLRRPVVVFVTDGVVNERRVKGKGRDARDSVATRNHTGWQGYLFGFAPGVLV